jgi:hypothetical protein
MSSYIPSGTYTYSPTSVYSPGLASGGQDYVAYTNTVSGTSNSIYTSRVEHNVSGIASYVINSATPSTFQVIDINGAAASKTITVSGATINGTTSATITSAYGVKTFVKTSAGAWIAY